MNAQYFIDNSGSEIRKVVIDIVHSRHQVSTLWTKKHKIHIPSEAEPDILEKIAYTILLRYKHIRVRILINDNLKMLREAKTNAELEEYQHIHHEWKLTEREIADRLGNVIIK